MSLSSGRSLGLHAAASSLTSLQLSCCRVQGPGGWDSTVALQGLSSLQHLKLSHMALSPATLQLPCLAQLKRLQLQDTGLSNLSCLTWLEQMQLRVSQLSAAVWADLRQIQHCQHLTHLSLDTFSGANAPAAVYSADASPWIGTLTSLQSLHLEGNFVLVAAVLQPLTAITSLSLDSLRGAVHPSFAALLSVLPDLQQLQCLRLRHVPSDTAPAAAFSSIAVCSRLQQLTLERCPVPFGAWEAMFLGQHLPQLHTLSFKEVAVMQPQAQQDEGLAAAAAGPGAQLAGAVDAAGGVGEQGGQALADPPLCFTAAHLDMLADCCPALQSLQLSLRPPVGGRFEYLSWDPACVPSALVRLPLTRLCLEYLEQPAFPVLAQLTGLQHLSVSDARRCLRSGVIAPLTALTGLTYLDLRMILYEQMPHTPGGTVGQGVCLTGSGLCNQVRISKFARVRIQPIQSNQGVPCLCSFNLNQVHFQEAGANAQGPISKQTANKACIAANTCSAPRGFCHCHVVPVIAGGSCPNHLG